MNFITYITTILLSFQPAYGDNETWEERSNRMEIIAQAIDDASSKSTCSDKYNVDGCVSEWALDKNSVALLLVSTGYWESKFAKNVHEGKCKPYECDSYRKNGHVVHRAKSPWQIQKTGLVTREEYSKMNGASLESTTISANVATRYLLQGMKRCKSEYGAFSMYATAKTCKWSGAKIRDSFYKFLKKKSMENFIKDADRQKQLFIKVIKKN